MFALGYYETHTINLFIVNPILPVTGKATGFLAMQNAPGHRTHREADITCSLPAERARRI